MKKKKFYDGKYCPFKNLKQKITYIKVSGVSFSSMYTKSGNKEIESAVKKIIDVILNEEKLNRKKVIECLISEWEKIHSKHNEAYDTSVRDDVLWYVNCCLEFREKKEISYKELSKLYTV
jgi:hypothetical protein